MMPTAFWGNNDGAWRHVMNPPPVGDPWAKSSQVSPTQGDTSDSRGIDSRPPVPAQGTWGGLEILEEIGQGGFGRVYRAWEPSLAREVALKIIRPPEDQPAAMSAILREGQLLARVHHPNVVTIHGAQQIGNEIGLWMEFVRGRTLTDIVRHDGPRAAGEAALIGVTLCQALAAVHQTGIVHRDIKAHNVMREAGGRIVLMDFGAGQPLTEPTREAHPIGTPVYMAPEVLAGSRATARSDIYSLGVLLYYLVTGSYPVEARTWTDFLIAHARSERRHLADVRPDLPPRFVHVVERATVPNPNDRYATPGAMLRDLAETATGEEPTTRRLTPHVDTSVDTDAQHALDRRRLQIAAAVGGGATAVWLLGGITSVVFNHTLGRSGFANESVLDWWGWGFKSLVAGTVYVTMLMLLWWMFASFCRVAARVAPPIRRFGHWLRAPRDAATRRLGLDDPETTAHALLAVQIAAMVVVCWQFRDLFAAFASFIDSASPADIEPLRPVHVVRHQNYNLAMTMMVFAGSIGAWQIVKLRRKAGATDGRASLAAVIGVIAATFVLLAFPYRLMWHNEREVATYGSLRCYVLGERPADLLLYCPTSGIPKTRIVIRTDPQLQRSQRVESIYTQ
jgi:serine/threonine protein kinase